MMKTEIINISLDNIKVNRIKKAARKICSGGLVAFPTETVYGLGADAFNSKAVAKIFKAKKRPLEDPLIIHIAQKEDLCELAIAIPDIAFKLVDKFWPGSLTLILKKSKKIPSIVSSGLDTVAVRMPSNEILLKLIKEAKTPIAAPSANLFGRPSPTEAQHVLDDLNGRIDMIIDGGKTSVGIESTILDLTQCVPSILRPGVITYGRLKKVTALMKTYKHNQIVSPGMYPSHYSPKAKVILVESNGSVCIKKVRELACEHQNKGCRVGIMTCQENKEEYPEYIVKILGSKNNLAVCASNLFSVLRDFDKLGVETIIAESFQNQGLGIAIMDRLRKASRG